MVRKKRDYVGKIPKGRAPPPSLGNPCYQKKNVKIPKLGGGGPPLGNFSHIIPFFFLSDNDLNKKRQAKIKIFYSTLLCFSHQIMLRCCITVLRFEINVLLNRSQILGKTNTLPWRAVEGWRGICDSLKDTKACTARGSTFFGFDFITSCM